MATDTRMRLVIDVQDQMSGPLLDSLLESGVAVATHYYRIGQRSRGEYELARLAMSVNRLLETKGVTECRASTTWSG